MANRLWWPLRSDGLQLAACDGSQVIAQSLLRCSRLQTEEIGLEPPRLLEPDVQSRAEQRDDGEDDEIAIIRLQLGHIGEIHAVDAGDRRRHSKNRSPGGELARDAPLPLLLEQIGRLEHGGENFAQASDPRLDPST